MNAATFTVNRIAAYLDKIAPFVEANPSDYYARQTHGKFIQARIQPKDLTLERLMAKGKKSAKVLPLDQSKRKAR